MISNLIIGKKSLEVMFIPILLPWKQEIIGTHGLSSQMTP